MKCQFCSLIKITSSQRIKKSKCRCRDSKRKFNNMCKRYSHISDCIPQAPASRSFQNNLIAVKAYIKKNNIPDMKISEMLELI